MQIYLARNNEQAGPYTLEQVNQMLAAGQIMLTDLAWHFGMSEWKPLGDLTGGQLLYRPDPAVQSAATLASESANHSHALDTVQQAAIQKSASQSGAQGITTDLAPVNKRVLAKVIDNLIIVLPLLLIARFLLSDQFLNAFIKITTASDASNMQKNVEQVTRLATSQDILLINGFTLFCLTILIVQVILLAKFGQTIGKKILGIRVVDENTGLLVPVYRSFLIREFLFGFLYQILFPVILLIDFGFIFSSKNRTLHDRLAKTLVVNANDSKKA